MYNNPDELTARIKQLTGWPQVDRPRIVTDTSDCMRIQRGDVLRLGRHNFVIEGNRYETRFGIGDQPKYWVFGAIDLETGQHKILKTVFHEEFHVHIGVFKVRCYRSPDKEAQVLKIVKGDRRFMQGYTLHDDKDNNVRVIDFIRGPTIFQSVYNINKKHEQYFYEDLPGILRKLINSLEAIQFLHDRGTCHGDIRNDHIIIEAETGEFRWIDFDLNQHVSDFDVWSMGNILNYIIGKGINSFQQVLKSNQFSDQIKQKLVPEDGSAFYEYRIMNLKKLYPYIPDVVNDILLHFTIHPRGTYEAVRELIGDFRDMLEGTFPPDEAGK